MSRKISPLLISTFSEDQFLSGERDVFDVSGRAESHCAQFHWACNHRKDDRLGGSVIDSCQSDEDRSGVCGDKSRSKRKNDTEWNSPNQTQRTSPTRIGCDGTDLTLLPKGAERATRTIERVRCAGKRIANGSCWLSIDNWKDFYFHIHISTFCKPIIPLKSEDREILIDIDNLCFRGSEVWNQKD
jgi:hypothetical protein